MKRADCGDWGMGGTEKNHKLEEGDLAPVRKGRVEEAESKTEAEARGSGVWDRREKNEVFEGKEGVGKVR